MLKWSLPVVLFLAGAVFPPAVSAWPTITIEPAQDNTLYETAPDQPGVQLEMSNGAGNFLFAGRTGIDAGFRVRRSLLRFDLASQLPADAQILGARLTLHQSKAAPGSPPAIMQLHRVLQAWGEGGSKGIGAEGQGNFAEAGDATWFHRIYPDQDWESAGGSYVAAPSAAVTVGQVLGDYTWDCSAALLADLALWQGKPADNHGWIIIGGEIAGKSAHRFNSRSNADLETRPRLTIRYRPANGVFADGFDQPEDCP